MIDNRQSTGGSLPSLAAVFDERCVRNLAGTSEKRQAIQHLVDTICVEHALPKVSAERISNIVWKRERFASSAIGHGLAFPHVRTRMVDRFLGAIGVSPEGMDFAGCDGRPTHLIFLTLSPWNARAEHIHLLSRLCSLLHDKAFCQHLLFRWDPQSLRRYLIDLDCRGYRIGQ